MAVSIRIDPETGVAIATCSGILRIGDAREGAAALWKTPGWTGRLAIWDFREAEFDVSSAQARGIAQFILAHQPATPPSRVAFVTPRDVDFGLARMYEVFREDSVTDFRVFRDFEEGFCWVRSPEPSTP